MSSEQSRKVNVILEGVKPDRPNGDHSVRYTSGELAFGLVTRAESGVVQTQRCVILRHDLLTPDNCRKRMVNLQIDTRKGVGKAFALVWVEAVE